jgi:hypothetical protein
MRWVGALEVMGPSQDNRPIWGEAAFPVRFQVRPLVVLDAEHGVPMADLEGRVQFFRGPGDRGKFLAFLRRSLNRFARPEDGAFILDLLRRAQQDPVARPVDARKLARKPLFRAERLRGRARVETLVSVPEKPEGEQLESAEPTPVLEVAPVTVTRHTEIQYRLLALAADMGLDTWVARNDRSRAWEGHRLGEMPGMLGTLPTQFNEATQRTIELIDVLWLRGNTIVAAFEVEATTSVYSGLLRMSDLLALQPNLDMKIFLVAPDERRDKVEQEILRPTFSLREKPLHEVCGFISFSTLLEKIEGIQRLGIAAALRPDFLMQTAEYFKPRVDA